MNRIATSCAALHAKCFSSPRPWSESEFAAYLIDPLVIFCGDADGFALGRVVVDEAELLTIAVSPDHRRRGLGYRLMVDFLSQGAARAAKKCFLEVAANNHAAIGLYRSQGFQETARRAGYYRQTDGAAIDAVVLSKRLNSA
jgi:ribosomal-protein-alanine N-acetyltransferase